MDSVPTALPAVDGTSDNRIRDASKLGGMLRYGIPNYRLPKDRLDEDIQAILETGVQVEFGKRIGKDITRFRVSARNMMLFLFPSVQALIRSLVSKANMQKA